MTGRKLSAFIDAIVSGRRPARFSATPDDVEVLRMAIALSAERPGGAKPDEQFVSGLYEELKAQASARADPGFHPIRMTGSVARPIRMSRGRFAIAAVAAGLVLVAGTASTTEAFNHGTAAPTAVPAPHGKVLLTGTFESADHRVVGQIVAYPSRPSWVYMNVDVAHYSGRLVCMLQSDNGSTVAVGTFAVRDGIGEFSRAIPTEVGRLRGARLLTPTGSVIGSATFA
ncbi:MAG TPA: hypothetical protein VMS00_01455 [Acidimicrobiales bacterium]|nr:hypothetical protein [Acidimicrobiales bacterium]